MSLQSTSMLRKGASHLASAAPSGAAVGYVYVRDKDTASSVTNKCNGSTTPFHPFVRSLEAYLDKISLLPYARGTGSSCIPCCHVLSVFLLPPRSRDPVLHFGCCCCYRGLLNSAPPQSPSCILSESPPPLCLLLLCLSRDCHLFVIPHWPYTALG